MSASSEYSHALTRRLALEAASRSLHIARNAAQAGEDEASRQRLQQILSDVLTESDRVENTISRLADRMAAEQPKENHHA